ncbi:MAG: hypothetical protein U0M06_07000 [Clostridia bacterium]|nr:hypothetical protein [Clostridia bacterium]
MNLETICVVIAETVPLFATLFSLIYGLKHFFKKGKPLFLQTITMAMASHALGSIYHLCQTLTSDTLIEGFTPAYLGRIGFFLFIITASYGQMDRIVDDGSTKMKPSRYIALLAPICAALLYIPNYIIEVVSIQTKIVYALVWIPAVVAVYFNLKHAIIPDMDFGFIKAIKPYNILILSLSFSELVCLTAWDYYEMVPLAISAVVFGVLCISTMIAAKKGAEKWTI